MIKQCRYCGTDFRCKPSHAPRKAYCSQACMAEDYKIRLKGQANPNFHNAGQHVCAICGKVFYSYTKTQQYCSDVCKGRAPKNLAHVATMKRSPAIPHTRNCPNCGTSFTTPKEDRRKYCSRQCAKEVAMRPKVHNVDKNQQSIVEKLRDVGASVISTAHMGYGFPDLVVGFRGKNFLFEVKNPDTRYGKKGMSETQKTWAQQWTGGSVIVIYTIDDALRAMGAL